MKDPVSILILLDYLFLYIPRHKYTNYKEVFQSLFYWITYSYKLEQEFSAEDLIVSILILLDYLFLLSVTPFLLSTLT